MAEPNSDNEWQKWWDARLTALETILGKTDGTVGHAAVPIFMGADAGGAADVLFFREHIGGTTVATASLIDLEEQPHNSQGSYELMICHRSDEEIGSNILSKLANYTLEAALEPGDTISIDAAVPEGSTIAALLFFDFARMTVREQACGLLLCVGITKAELDLCNSGNRCLVEAKLKSAGVYPFTDWFRSSVAS